MEILKDKVFIHSDKVSHDKAINNAKSPKCDGYQHGLTSVVYTFLNKKSSNKFNVKWKGYNNSFNNQIDKKVIVR